MKRKTTHETRRRNIYFFFFKVSCPRDVHITRICYCIFCYWWFSRQAMQSDFRTKKTTRTHISYIVYGKTQVGSAR